MIKFILIYKSCLDLKKKQKVNSLSTIVPNLDLAVSCPGPWTKFLLAALEEARDICTYLKPLQPFFEELKNIEFPNVKAQIRPLMHMVGLVWANSRYYNSPARIIVLLQDTCNLLIHQVRCSRWLSTSDLYTSNHCRQRNVWRDIIIITIIR